MAAAAPLILLTGATGFVGRQVLRALGERGCRVRAVVRDGKQDRLAASHAIEKTVTSPDIFAESAGWWTRCLPRCRYRHPRRLVRRARAISAIAEKSGLRGGNAAACARRDRRQGPPLCRHRHLLRIRLERRTFECRDAAQAVDALCRRRRPTAFNALSQSLPPNGIEFAWCRLFYLYGREERRGRAPAGALSARHAQRRRAGRIVERPADPRLPRRARRRPHDRGGSARAACKGRSISAPARR